ncbi:MAG: helix-turn-helix domain-containing protein [Balneola sp.]
MEVIVTTREELQELINNAVEHTFNELMPTAIRLAKQKEWLTTDDVMEYLSCSRRTVQYLRDERRISFHQEGRIIRYHIDDLHEYMKRNRIRVWER